MKAEDILNNTDPQELRNLLRRLKLDQSAGMRPPSSIVVTQAPTQYPSQSGVGSDLDWFNVRDYGAVGDGTTDDTNAINAAIAALNSVGRGVLYFPAGAYLVSSGLTIITAVAHVMGDGTASNDNASYGSKIICTSATAKLFEISALSGLFQDLVLINTAATPSAGAGIYVSGTSIAQRVDIHHVRVHGFYIGIDIQNAQMWIVDNCAIDEPVLYGLRFQNASNLVRGEFLITQSHFRSFTRLATAGIKIEKGGGGAGGEISGCFINFFVTGIDVSADVMMIRFLVANNVISNTTTGHGIVSTGSSGFVDIIGNIFDLANVTSNNTGSCISLTNCVAAVITGNVLSGGTAPAAITLDTVTGGARIVGNYNSTFSSLVSQTGCTGVVTIEPASTVAAETTYGLSSAVGTSTLYARADHTHGTPAAGQYRQFVVEVSGGDFTFVIDEDGNPIMALEDLE